MAHTAICENSDCDKGEWDLTKHPSQYAGGGVSCPECGSTRTEVFVDESEEPAQSTGAATSRQEAPPQQQAPAPQAQGGATPAVQQGGSDLSAGEGLIAALDNEAPAEVQKQGVESVGRGIIRFAKAAISYGEKKDEMRSQRAQNADVQRVEDKPDCEVCGTTISEIPVADDRFQCENCGAEYEVVGGR